MRKSIVRSMLILVFAATLVFSLALAASASTYTNENDSSIPEELSISVTLQGTEDGNGESLSAGVLTATVQGKARKGFAAGYTRNATITITNKSEKIGKVSFSWTGTNVNSLTIDGTSRNDKGSGSFTSVPLAKDSSVTVVLTSATNATQNILALSGFTFTEVSATTDLTVNFDSTAGSITLDGAPISSDVTNTMKTTGSALVANANSGVRFLGWCNSSTGAILSTSTSYTVKSETPVSLRAVFASGAWYRVGDYLFDSLTDAITQAANGSSKTIILVSDGTLPAGTYTIPSGVTLLIPYNDANTLNTTEPTEYTHTEKIILKGADAYVIPTAYRTLTMAEGAHIVVNGAMSVSGGQCCAQLFNGMPMGPLGFVNMAKGSSITINSGANLYAWGYITGQGTVEIKSGGTVYEDFQMGDWRGGTAASAMNGNSEKVFMMSQYAVQNIEVPMTLRYGAKEYCHLSLVASYIYGDVTFPFIGTDSMFIMGEGAYIVKDYNETTGAIEVQVYGDIEMSGLDLSISTYKLNSANYVLPLNNRFHIELHSGETVVSQDMAFLPGSKVTVHEKAQLTLADNINLFVYDTDEWANKGYIYYSLAYDLSSNEIKDQYGRNLGNPYNDRRVLPYANKTTQVPDPALVDSQIRVDGILDASKGRLFTTAGGAAITGVEGGKIILNPANENAASPTVTYQGVQYVNSSGDQAIEYKSISINFAQLQNGDGTYVTTADGVAEDTYTYYHGVWHNSATYHVEPAVDPTCTATGKTQRISCDCEGNYSEGGEVIPALGHEWGKATITMGADGKSWTATRVCSRGCTETVNATVTSTVKTSSTCTVMGTTTYTGTFAEAWAQPSEALTNDLQDIPLENHNWSETGYQWGDGYSTCVASRTCTAFGEHTETANAVVTDSVAVEATCISMGTTEYTATFEVNWATTQTKQATNIAKNNNHQWNTTTYEWETDGSACTATHSCTRDPDTHEFTETAKAAITSEMKNDATCVAMGTTTYTATFAEAWAETQTKDVVDIAIDGSNHEIVNHDAQAPTCTEIGWDAYETCNLCNYTTYQEKAALTHDLVQVEAKATTCTEGGWNAHEYCDRDGCNYTTKVEIGALNHNYVGAVTKEATCKEAGVMTYTCQNDASHTYTEEIAKSETHTGTAVEIPAVAPTCTTTGLTAGSKCSVCEAVITAQTEVPALQHNYVSAVTKEATCKEAGVMTYTCQNDASHTYTEEIAKSETHTGTAVEIPAVAPTCTTTGLTAGSKCSVCDAVITAQEVVPALQHNYVGAVTKEATCKEAGVMTYTCQNDASHTYTEEIAATGHSYTNNCDTSCNVCGEIREITHDYVPVVTEPTCTDDGYTTYSCANCGNTYTDDKVEALGHKYNGVVTKDPTCIELGVKTFTCSACGDSYTKDISATGHSYNSNVTAPTCTEAGYTTYVCGTCGNTYTSNEVAALGHKYDHACDPSCNTCGENREITHVPGTAVRENDTVNAATGEGSYEMAVYCSVCTAELSRNKFQQEAFKEDTIPEEIKETYTTVEQLFTHMEESIVEQFKDTVGKSEVVSNLIDVALQYWDEANDTWQKADEDSFPADGKLEVVLPVPAGTSHATHTYFVGHMFTSNAFGKTIGEMEYPAVEAYTDADGKEYIKFYVTGLSPIAVSAVANDPCAAGHTAGEAVEENRVASHKDRVANTEVVGHYDSVIKCSVCGEEMSRETIALPDADTVFAGSSVGLEGILNLVVVINENKLQGTNHTVVITRDYSDNLDKNASGITPSVTTEIPLSQCDWYGTSTTRRQVSYKNIGAKEMGDTVHYSLYSDGKLIATYTDSIAAYAQRMLDKYTSESNLDAKKATLYLELLNYGAAAQTYFTYNEANLVNSGVTEYQNTFAIPTVESVKETQVKGNGYAGSMMDLGSEIRLVFVINKTAMPNAAYVEITFRDHRDKDDSDKCVKILAEDFEQYSETRWQFTATGMAIADGDTEVTCTAYDSEGNVLTSSIDSMNHYAYRQRSKNALYPMLLRFTQAAYNYFH